MLFHYTKKHEADGDIATGCEARLLQMLLRALMVPSRIATNSGLQNRKQQFAKTCGAVLCPLVCYLALQLVGTVYSLLCD